MADLPPSAPPSGERDDRTEDSTPYDPVDAFTYAWQRFAKKPATTLVPVAIGLIGQAVAFGLLYLVVTVALVAVLLTASNTGSSTTHGVGLLVVFFGGLLLYSFFGAVAQIVYAGWAKAGLEITRGSEPPLGELYQGWNKRDVGVAAVVMAVAVTVPSLILAQVPLVGSLLQIACALGIGYFLQFGILCVVDQGLEPIPAIRASIDLARANYRKLLVFDLLVVAGTVIGAILLGLGTFVSTPLIVIASAFTYRKLLGQPVLR